MKKLFIAAIAVFAFGTANAQTNQKGSMTLDLVGGFSIGSGKDKVSDYTEKYTVVGVNYGLDFQYGLAENFSAGLGLELGSSVFSPKDLSSSAYADNYDVTMSTFKVSLEGRYYFINNEKLNVFAGPDLGYMTGKDKLSVFSSTYSIGEETKYSGMTLGLTAGMHYYFTDVFGITAQLGYDSNSAKSKETADMVSYKRNFGGVKLGAGVSFKF
jgi:hypothetical protein